MKKKIIIVGAGPGGLSAGMLLSKKGFDVEIFERLKGPGGRNSSLDIKGYKFDLGPTFLMMKYLLDDIFKDCGKKSEDYLKFKKLSPMYRLNFVSEQIDMFSDHKKMHKELKKVYPEDAKGLWRFLKKEEKRFNMMMPCLEKDYSYFYRFFNKLFIRALPHFALGRSLIGLLGDYFKNDHAKICFTFQAKYLGMSPWTCPAAFSIMPVMEHKHGIYHVEGGLSQISQAMAKAVKEQNGKIHYNTPVKEIIVDKKKAKGVVLTSGKKVYGDEVIINADFGYAMTKILKDKVPKYKKKRITNRKFSCSTFMLYLGLKKKYDIEHHTIVIADKYKRNIDDIQEHKFTEEDISFYIRNASINDKTIAPKGKSAIYILVPVSNNKAGINWKNKKKYYRDLILSKLKDRLGLEDIEKNIEVEKIITPEDWEKDYNVFLGATFNLSHKIMQMLWFRPHNEFHYLKNCYLVGGGTHPGSGLPTIYQSGRIASDLISKKYKK